MKRIRNKLNKKLKSDGKVIAAHKTSIQKVVAIIFRPTNTTKRKVLRWKVFSSSQNVFLFCFFSSQLKEFFFGECSCGDFFPFSILSQNEKLVFDTLTSCLAIMITVFNENFRPQLVNKSSNDGPKSSKTIALYRPPHVPKWKTRGIPSVGDSRERTRKEEKWEVRDDC